MFEKSDQRFLQALEMQEELEKRLQKLRFWRKIMAFYALFGVAGSVMTLVFNQEITRTMPGTQATLMPFAVMSLFFPTFCWIKGASIHSEIRTLLVFKKLSEARMGKMQS